MNSPRAFIHCGDAEDILCSSSLYNKDDTLEPQRTEDEERQLRLIKIKVEEALFADSVAILRDLLQAMPLLANVLDKPIVHLAANYGALCILRDFIKECPQDINSTTSDYEATTPLYWAVRAGQGPTVAWLLKHGAVHQPLNVYQHSAVYVAVRYQHWHLLKVLKQYGCDPDTPNADGDIPILYVVREGLLEGVEALLEIGANIYISSLAGKTVIHAVLSCEYSKRLHILQRLFKAGYKQPIHQHLLISLILPALKLDDDRLLATLVHLITDLTIQQETQEVTVERGAVKCLEVLIGNMGFLLSMGYVVRHAGSRVLALVLRLVNGDEAFDEGLSLVYECIQQSWKMGGYRARVKGELRHLLHVETEYKIQILLDHGVDIYQKGQDTLMSPMYFATKISMVCVVFWMLRAGVDPRLLPDIRSPLAAALNGMFAYFLNVNMIKVAYLWVNYLPSHNDPAIEVYLKKTQHLDTAVNRSTNIVSVIEDLQTLLVEKSTNAKRLTHLSRIAVLRALGLNAHKKVSQLPLPTRLKEYILLRDLEEMCLDLNRRVQDDGMHLNASEDLPFCLCSPLNIGTNINTL